MGSSEFWWVRLGTRSLEKILTIEDSGEICNMPLTLTRIGVPRCCAAKRKRATDKKGDAGVIDHHRKDGGKLYTVHACHGHSHTGELSSPSQT